MDELTSPDPISAPVEHPLGRKDLLRWLYLGRLTLVTGILAGALLAERADAQDIRVATIMFLVALAVTSGSFWYTHLRGREPGVNFRYAQVMLDIGLVTAIVHITNGPESSFAPIYILVISSGALLLPFAGGVLIAALASIVYFADLAWGFQGAFNPTVALQIALFTVVALVTGIIGDRLRQAGLTLGEVASELRQLRLDTGDILASLSTGVLTVDGQGRLVYANPAAEAFLGIDVTSFTGRPVLEELERIAPGMGAVLGRSIGERRPVERFRTTSTRDGRKLRLGVSTTILERSEDEPPSATAIFQDITDLERIDELNRRTERLEAVAALSASLAHEIKNPLASIRSAIEQLSGSRLAGTDRAVLDRLVLTESDRLSRLLSEFLDYSGLKLGTPEELDLRGIVLDCLTVCRQHPEVEGVELVTELDDVPVLVMGDGDLLHRALFNLVLNGAQSTGPGGRVVVSVANERNRLTPRGTQISHPVRLAVRDSGPGISPSVADRIFDPFFTTREKGSGLGLAVVHRAVDAHSGATFVDRAPEGGAQFVIFLPGVGGNGRRGV